ncbi:MAG: CAAX prenyl protease-related protein [Verrucomicrobia bacterium]|nr:CAAX prenyl protease-related protein [Verrucomicrobiota bacterium]
MSSLLQRLRGSPLAVRVVPFAVFLVLTWAQGQCGETGRYWFYLAKTLAGAALLAVVWKSISECRWAFSWEAVVAGVAVFALWVGLDGLYPPLDALLAKVGLGGTATGKSPLPWNPHAQFGDGSALAWLFIAVRALGSTFVVPPLEEVFYRSFLHRYLVKTDFAALPLNHFGWMPFLATAAAFGLTHFEWVPGILCGLIYQGLVLRKNRLGDALTAHAITNALLAAWVLGRGAWKFW